MASATVVTVRRNFTRPDPATLRQFEGLPTGFIVDAMSRRGAMSSAMRPVGRFKPFVGSALTVVETAGSNLACGVAMGEMQPHDVLVVKAESFTEVAILGGNLVGMFKNAGAAGIIVDGAIRDAEEIEQIGLPVYALSITPNSPYKHGPGSVGQQIAVGNLTVSPGDIVVGDRDGIVVVPQDRIAETLDALEHVKKKEAKQDIAIDAGLAVPEWLAEFSAGGGVEIVG